MGQKSGHSLGGFFAEDFIKVLARFGVLIKITGSWQNLLSSGCGTEFVCLFCLFVCFFLMVSPVVGKRY